jgi:hypothetical protein
MALVWSAYFVGLTSLLLILAARSFLQRDLMGQVAFCFAASAINAMLILCGAGLRHDISSLSLHIEFAELCIGIGLLGHALIFKIYRNFKN